MKQYLKKTTSLLLTVTLLVISFAMPASAAVERSSLYLSCYRAWLTPESGGKIDVTIDVQAVGDMDDVGATKVVMYESTDGGTTWNRDGTYVDALHPELLQQNTYWYYETPISHQGTPGYKYFAIITLYAGDSTGYDTKEYQTTTVTAKWF